jgi:uncharacterized membrane protein (Fun14 family)
MSDTKANVALAPRAIQGWKMALLVVSVLMMGAGLAVPLIGANRGAPEPRIADASRTIPADTVQDPTSVTGMARGFVDSGPTPSADLEPQPEADVTTEAGGDVWSALLFTLGFSFFVGFSLGYAVRTFFRFTIVGIGMMLFMLFGLEHAGLIEVHWSAFEGRFDSITQWIGQQTGGFKAFVTGQLPSAGTALAGLFIGWTRK